MRVEQVLVVTAMGRVLFLHPTVTAHTVIQLLILHTLVSFDVHKQWLHSLVIYIVTVYNYLCFPVVCSNTDSVAKNHGICMMFRILDPHSNNLQY